MTFNIRKFAFEFWYDPDLIPRFKLVRNQGWERKYFGYEWAILIDFLCLEMYIIKGL